MTILAYQALLGERQTGRRAVSGSPALVFLLKESAESRAGTAVLRQAVSVAGQRVSVEKSHWDRRIVYVCVCMQERQIYGLRRRGAESWEERKAAGLIRSYPLNRGSTWIGWIVEDSEAVGVARALLCVHQFQINPAASAKVSLSHMLNPFLFRDALSCC